MTDKTAAIAALHERCADALDDVRLLFRDPVRMTLFVRNPAHPDGSRDVLVTDDDVEASTAAMKQVCERGNKRP